MNDIEGLLRVVRHEVEQERACKDDQLQVIRQHLGTLARSRVAHALPVLERVASDSQVRCAEREQAVDALKVLRALLASD